MVTSLIIHIFAKFLFLANPMLNFPGGEVMLPRTSTLHYYTHLMALCPGLPLLTNKDISLIVRGRLYSRCVWSSMLCGSETSPVREENEVALQRVKKRIVRWMCGNRPMPLCMIKLPRIEMVYIQQISCRTHQKLGNLQSQTGNFVVQQSGARKLLNFVACLTLALSYTRQFQVTGWDRD